MEDMYDCVVPHGDIEDVDEMSSDDDPVDDPVEIVEQPNDQESALAESDDLTESQILEKYK